MNWMSLITKTVIVLVGCFLLGDAIISLAKRKMTESFCLMWGTIAVAAILTGAFIQPSVITRYISPIGLILISIIVAIGLYATLFLTHTVSELMRKTNDMAIEISLLKKENEDLKNSVEKIAENEQ